MGSDTSKSKKRATQLTEDEIEELSNIVSLVMDLGAGWTPTLKQLLDIDSPLNIELLNYLIDSTEC